MQPRERVFAALNFESPDKVPLECHRSPAGLVEHGKKLKNLWKLYPQDFDDFTNVPIPTVDPSEFDSEGRYYAIKKDEWGVEWKYLVSGVRRVPIYRPLDDLQNLKSYYPLIKNRGIICGDDYARPGGAVKRAVHRFANENNLKVIANSYWFWQLREK